MKKLGTVMLALWVVWVYWTNLSVQPREQGMLGTFKTIGEAHELVFMIRNQSGYFRTADNRYWEYGSAEIQAVDGGKNWKVMIWCYEAE